MESVGAGSARDSPPSAGRGLGLGRPLCEGHAQPVLQDGQYSPDGVNWLSVPSTLKARTDLTGLSPATPYFFRVRRSTKAGTGDGSDPVRLLVV
jgi:hypothetical protein